MKLLLPLLLCVATANAQVSPLDNSRAATATGLAPTVNCANGSSANVDSGTLYIDCTNNRIGINEAAPGGTLEVTSNQAATGFVLAITSQSAVAGNILSVLGNGNVGIGTTAPTTKLHMSSGTLTIDGNATVGMVVTNKSGIGALTIPQYLFHVGDGNNGATDANVQVFNSKSGAVSYGARDVSVSVEANLGSASSLGYTGTSTNHDFYFKTNNAEVARLTTGGSLGIGNIAPATKLHLSSGTLRVDGTASQLIVSPIATQTIAAGNTIAADACGGIKRIDAGGAVTTSTTDTFTAPSGANAGCCMDVINVDTVDTITLDANANFNAAADIAMTPCDVIRVCSDGVDWFPIDALVANTCN